MRIKQSAIAVLALLPLSLMAACGSSADFSTGTSAAGGGSLSEDPYSDPGTAAGPDTVAPSDEASPSDGPTDDASATTDPGATEGPVDNGGGTTGGGSTPTVGGGGGAPIRVTFIQQGTAGAGALTGSTTPNGGNGVDQTMKALVAYVNANGGVGGRKIVATGFKQEATSQTDQRIADCKTITEDQKAQVLIDMNNYIFEEGWACFAQHKVSYFGNTSAADRTFLSSRSPYINSTAIALDRQMRSVVDATEKVGFLKGQKVGVLMADEPGLHRQYEKSLKPALAKIGITNQVVRYVGGANPAEQQTAATNAVLAFATAGVTRIVFFHNILVYLTFTAQASSQKYFPRYVYTDYQAMAAVAAYYGKSNKQNVDALAVSQQAVQDDATPTDINAPYDRKNMTAGQRNCLDILSKQTKKDYYDPSKSGDSQGAWTFYCDEFLLWWEAAKKIGASWTPADTVRGLTLVGKTFNTPLQHSVDFGRGNNDGGDSVRVGKYNSGCACFVKATDWIKVPV